MKTCTNYRLRNAYLLPIEFVAVANARIVFKDAQSSLQCTVEMYGDKLEFLIKALWIAHFR